MSEREAMLERARTYYLNTHSYSVPTDLELPELMASFATAECDALRERIEAALESTVECDGCETCMFEGDGSCDTLAAIIAKAIEIVREAK